MRRLGVQLLGRWNGDERLIAAARWLAEIEFGKPRDGSFRRLRPLACAGDCR